MVFSDGGNHDIAAAAPRVETIEGNGAAGVVVPGDSFILTATYIRQGDDLLLSGEGGREVLVRDYFAGDAPRDLLTETGARVTGATADILAGPLAPGQLAQAGGQLAQAAAPIGRVQVVDGTATATHTDGTTVTLTQGAPVYRGDVVQTGADGKVGLLFVDKTTFSMGDNARMILNDLVYNPSGGEQSSVVTVLQGLFIFVTGEVGKLNPESVVINTPVATLGVRGTKGVIAEFSQVGGDLKVGCLNGQVVAQTGSGGPVFIPPGSSTTITNPNLPPLPPQLDPVFLNSALVNALNTAVSLPMDPFSVDPNRQDFNGVGTPPGGGGPGNEPGGGPGNEPGNQPGGGGPDGGGGGNGRQGLNLEAPPSAAEIAALLGVQPGAGQISDFGYPSLALASPFNAAPSSNLTSSITSTNLTGTTSIVSLPGGGFIGPGGTLFTAGGVIVGTVNAITSPGDTTVVSGSGGVLIGSTQFVTNTYAGSTQPTTTPSSGTSSTTTTTVPPPPPPAPPPPPPTSGITTNEDTPLTLSTVQVAALNSGTTQVTLSLAVLHGTLKLNSTTNLTLIDNNGSDGTLSFSGTASDLNSALTAGLVYTPSQNFAGTDSLTVITINGQTSSTLTTSIAVQPVNDAPTTTPDTYATTENAPLGVAAAAGVLANDSDPEGDAISLVAVEGQGANVGKPVSLAGGGRVTVQADGSFTFDPGTDFDSLAVGQNAVTTFQYTVADTSGAQSTETVSITVNGENDAPVAVNDAFATGENAILSSGAGVPGVLANDTDIDLGDMRTVAAVNGQASNVGAAVALAGGGSVTVQADGNFTFNPGTAFDFLAAGQSATTSFTYTARDLAGAQSTATATITVNGVNDAPVAVADSFATGENTVLSQSAPGVLLNDTDAEGGPLTVAAVNGQASNVGNAVSLAGGGSATVQADGSFTFNPGTAFDFLRAGQNAVTSFTYTAKDAAGAQSTATASITVNGVNDAPVAVADSFATGENTVLSRSAPGVLGNDTDADAGDVLTVASVNGQASNVGNAVTLAGGGSVTMQADGSFTFDPGTDFDFLPVGQSAVTSFTYTAADLSGARSTATARITVNGVNDAPVVTIGSGAGGGTGNILFVSDSGAGGGIASALAGDGYNVTQAIDDFTLGSNPALLGNLSGFDAIFWSASGDGFGNVHTDPAVFANLTNYVQNGGRVFVTGYDSIASPTDAPLIAFLGGTTSSDFGGVSSAVSGANSLSTGLIDIRGITPTGFYNDTDTLFPAAGTVTVVASQLVGGASWSLRSLGSGEIAYVSNGLAGTTGSYISWIDTSPGGNGVYNAAIRNFAFNSGSGFNTNEDTPLNISTISVSDVDAGSTPLTVALSVSNGALALNSTAGLTAIDGNGADGTLVYSGTQAALNAALGTGVVYTPGLNFNGSDAISVTANDGLVSSLAANQRIQVASVNDAPIAVADHFATSENTILVVPGPGVLANDTDVEGDPLSVSLYSPNLIFGTSSSGDSLFTIDLTSSQVTTIGPLNTDPARFTTPVSMAVRPSDGAIFVNNNSPAGDDVLAIVDPTTGLATSLGGGGFIDGCLAFDQNDVLYTISSGQLFRVSQTDGSGTLIGGTAIPRIGGLDFNPADGLLYAATLSGGQLLKVDPTSGAVVGSVQMSFNGSSAFLSQSLLFDASGNLLLTDGSFLYDVDIATGALSNQRFGGAQGLGLIKTAGNAVLGDHGGTFMLQADGSFTFDPGTDFSDLATGQSRDTTITYQAFDGSDLSAPQTLTVTVNGLSNGPVLDLDADNSSGQAGGNYAASYTGSPFGFGIPIADNDLKITDPDSQNLSSATITLNNATTVLEFLGSVTSVSAFASNDIAVGSTFVVRVELDPSASGAPLGAGVSYANSVKSITIFVPETGQTWTAVPTAGSGSTQVFNDVSGGTGLLTDQVFSFSNNISGPTIGGENASFLQVSFFDFENAPTLPGMLSSTALPTAVPLNDGDPSDSNLIAFTTPSGGVGSINLSNLTVLNSSDSLQIVGTLPANISAAFNGTGQIVLSGTASLADYQAAIGMIQALNTSPFTSSVGVRTVDITLTDDTGTAGNTVQAFINGVGSSPGDDTVSGSAGNDVLDGNDGNDIISGLGGNDLLFGGLGDDTLTGGAGNDQLFGGQGNDAVDGGAGDDILSWVTGEGNDTLIGGADNDQLAIVGAISDNQWVLSRGLSEIQILQTSTALGLATLDVQTIETIQFFGIDGNDSLRILGSLAGTAPATSAISFYGGLGSDALDASTTDNAIVAFGGDGNDVLIGGAGNDTLYGDTGNDRIDGNGGNDVIDGGDGDDFLSGGDGDDLLQGGLGDDILGGGAGNDILDGGVGGNDVAIFIHAQGGIVASLASGMATSGGGTDQLIDIESLAGGQFSDTLTGNGLANELYGLGGSDRIQGGGGDDFLYGGTGFDVAIFSDATSSIFADVLNGIVSGGFVGTDHLTQFNRIVGSDFSDTFVDAPDGYGAAMKNVVHEFEGAGGNDRILGIGFTRAGFAGAANGVAVDLEHGLATDIVGTSIGADMLYNVSRVRGSANDDAFLSSTSGFNEFRPDDGVDVVTGQGADVRVSYVTSPGSVDVDLAGNVANDDGYGKVDQLIGVRDVVGSDNADILRGDGADNQLFGGAGNDALAGRGGADLLDGGTGIDRVAYTGAGGPIAVDMTAGTVVLGGSTDTLVSIERVNGTAFNDSYLGGSTPGADTSVNIFRGGAGDDFITGDSRTIIDYADATNVGVTANIGPGSIIDASAAGLGTDSLLGNNSILGVFGSDFNDTLTGNALTSASLTLPGNRLRGNAGDDVLDGSGGGADEADYINSPNRVLVNLGGTDVPASGGDPVIAAGTALDGFGFTDTLISIENIRGSAFDDRFYGSAQIANKFRGLEGNDFMDGGGGFGNTADYTPVGSNGSVQGIDADLAAGRIVDNFGFTDTVMNIQNVIGSDLGDVIAGDGNANTLYGQAGNDLLIGGAGDDILFGGTGTDTADYSGAASFINADLTAGLVTGVATGTDSLMEVEAVKGSDFNDTFVTSGAVAGNGTGTFNRFEGLGGDDTIIGNGNTALDYANASSGVTVTFSRSGAGTAVGDSSVGTDTFSGVNSVRGSMHADSFFGGAGNESFRGRSGDDLLDGGAGTGDEADYRFSLGGADADLQAGFADDGYGFTDTLRNIENLRGSDNDDTLRGDGNSNVIHGNAGDDLIEGRGGSDFLFGEDGNDVFVAGAGTGDFDVMDGGLGVDRVEYADETAAVFVDLGKGTATGASIGTDTLISIEQVTGSAQGDTLIGGVNADTLIGGDGNDVIAGGGGRDYVVLGAGNDTLRFDSIADGETIAIGQTRGPSRTGDIVADFTSGTDIVQFGRGLTAGAPISQGTNFAIIGTAFDGTLNPVTAPTSYNTNQATLVYSTADGALSYLQNGAASASYTVLFTNQHPGVALADTDLQSA